MKKTAALVATILATTAHAETVRELGAHEHGVGQLNIAINGTTVALELNVPGADIVGFEYEAKSAEDRAAIDSAVATLAKPLDLFVFPTRAECTVTQASAALESEDANGHGHEAHEHEEHAESADHGDHHHGEDGHGDHAEVDAGHTEFHAEYVLKCASPDELSGMEFAYFDAFEDALELEVQIVSASGAQAFEVKRDAPVLDLRGMF